MPWGGRAVGEAKRLGLAAPPTCSGRADELVITEALTKPIHRSQLVKVV